MSVRIYWQKPSEPPRSGFPAQSPMPWRQGDGPEPKTITYPYGREPAVWVWTSSDRHPDPVWYWAKVVAKHIHPDGRIVLGCEVRFGWHSATYFRSYLWGEDSVLAASRTGRPPGRRRRVVTPAK